MNLKEKHLLYNKVLRRLKKKEKVPSYAVFSQDKFEGLTKEQINLFNQELESFTKEQEIIEKYNQNRTIELEGTIWSLNFEDIQRYLEAIRVASFSKEKKVFLKSEEKLIELSITKAKKLVNEISKVSRDYFLEKEKGFLNE
jgi:hypothetical protein